MSSSAKLMIKNCEQIVQICDKRQSFKRGEQQDCIAIINRRPASDDNSGSGCCLVIGSDGIIKGLSHFSTKITQEL